MSTLNQFHYKVVNLPDYVERARSRCVACWGPDYPGIDPEACPCWLTNNHKTVVIVEGPHPCPEAYPEWHPRKSPFLP